MMALAHRLSLLIALVGGTTLLGVSAQDAARGGTPAASPRLIVLLVVDQMRADYVEWYGGQWTQGLKRLTTEGALFPRATYPYAITKTCAGHASIGTGVLPATHGMIDNDWYDSTQRKFVGCTADPAAVSVGFGGQPGAEHHSALALRAPTLADQLQRQRPLSRVVSLALKARSAIGLGGRGGPRAIFAWEEDTGVWASSTAFTRTAWPEVDAYVRAHPSSAARGQAWNRRLPPASYRNEDEGKGELAPAPFPHLLVPPTGVSFTAIWDMSPWSDAYLGDMAGTLVERLKLGQVDGPDMLAVGFSALDFVGHAYGPRSHEVQDLLVRLDETIGRLMNVLDKAVGRDRYVIGLSSDHGVALLPEQAAAVIGAAGGRLALSPLGLAVDIALGNELGGRQFIEAITGSYVHFLPGVLDRIKASPRARLAVEAAAKTAPGVERVYWSWDLAATTPTTDPFLAGLRKSYFAGRSGDLAFLPRPNWVVVGAGTQHGSMHPYDTQVPLVLYGAGIRPGRYTAAVTPLDLAPTLGSVAGITLQNVEGRVLREALTR